MTDERQGVRKPLRTSQRDGILPVFPICEGEIDGKVVEVSLTTKGDLVVRVGEYNYGVTMAEVVALVMSRPRRWMV